MSHANLTARYRPQKFSELAGQETVRAILSRAAAESSVAPAYLFSGTRGVGKTTVARVFAKALNCAHAPTAEPCNECGNCRQITMGTAVDVVEIDGASNRGIDDVRKLKEVVGYAPMQGRYKVFIIDEAHMLSRDAFNALLKTLEEPPANVTFILATTEPHKFPATIISRCQHYVFKRLPEAGLEAHLSSVLARENVPFEEAAVRLLARRAAGSVRDAMSLLGQVLALGGETLTEYDTRTVLGLAGQELFFTLFGVLRRGNSAELTKMVGEMLDSGLDLGFFLREMALCWRNMFILRQAGDAALAMLDIPAKEADRWKEEASSFDLSHIHAAWQMTIDGQRRVLTSLEPALALELLLCNIAMLPRLMPLEGVARMGRAGKLPNDGGANDGGPESGSQGGAASGQGAGQAPAGASSAPMTGASPAGTSSFQASGQMPDQMPGQMSGQMSGQASGQTSGPATSIAAQAPAGASGEDAGIPSAFATPDQAASFATPPAFPPVAQEAPADPFDEGRDEAYLAAMAEDLPSGMDDGSEDFDGEDFGSREPDGPAYAAPVSALAATTAPTAVTPAARPRVVASALPEDCTWSAFMRYCKTQEDLSPAFSGMLRTVSGEWRGGILELTPGSEFSAERLRMPETEALFAELVRAYYGDGVELRYLPPPRVKTAAEIREALRENPAVHLLETEMGARLIDYGVLQ